MPYPHGWILAAGRDGAQIVREIEADGQPYVVFTDNHLGSRPEFLRELCAALRPVDIIWSVALSNDVPHSHAVP